METTSDDDSQLSISEYFKLKREAEELETKLAEQATDDLETIRKQSELRSNENYLNVEDQEKMRQKKRSDLITLLNVSIFANSDKLHLSSGLEQIKAARQVIPFRKIFFFLKRIKAVQNAIKKSEYIQREIDQIDSDIKALRKSVFLPCKWCRRKAGKTNEEAQT